MPLPPEYDLLAGLTLPEDENSMRIRTVADPPDPPSPEELVARAKVEAADPARRAVRKKEEAHEQYSRASACIPYLFDCVKMGLWKLELLVERLGPGMLD